MSKGLITKQYLTDIADAIREKTGEDKLYLPSEMAEAVRSIETKGNIIVQYVVEGAVYEEAYSAGQDILHPYSFTPEKDNYMFYGWSNSSTTDERLEEATATQNTRLYALFLKVATEFVYKGLVESFAAKKGVTYFLEVYGGKGGKGGTWSWNYNGGYGGYSSGYYSPIKDSYLYICCGGAGSDAKAESAVDGGYNGGGAGRGYYANVAKVQYLKGGGGGATHIALTNGMLKEIGYDEFVTNGKGLLVAGGGGGCGDDAHAGSGGGLSGGGDYGGTQSSAGSVASGLISGGFGYGASYGSGFIGGGGGGLYGGGAANYRNGSGGSGYIGGVIDGYTTNGLNDGNGKATITIVSII